MSLNNYPIESMIASAQSFLETQQGSVGEHALIQHFKRDGYFDITRHLTDSLALFHKHFVTMHVLYRLQERLGRDGRYSLRIGVLAIELQRVNGNGAAVPDVSQTDPGLREYYMDWRHLEAASDDTVASLLRGFWRDFKSWQNSDYAYKVLGINPDAQWPEVQRAYRQRVNTAHPDKGGQAAEFAEVREAYLVLKQRLAR